MKYAIVFPGQGSQSLAMLSELADHFPVVRRVFERASDTLGVNLWDITQTDATALNQTHNTQPIMLAAGYATYWALNEARPLSPECLAGHSLGEYTALVASGALTLEDGIALVRSRAALMQSAVPVGAGAMAAILGLDDATVIQICAEFSGDGVVEAVNFNAPGQVVISGNTAAVKAVCALMKSAGAARAIVLPVSVPSHCALMKEASEEFANAVNATPFVMPNIEVLHNVDCAPATDIATIKTKLIAQLHQPVLWSATVRAMAARGVQTIIEAGPGKILTGLSKRIDKSITARAALDSASIASILEEI